MKTISLIIAVLFGVNYISFSQTYTMPAEDDPHEGTWLQWPHQYEYGIAFRNENDATWVAMANALQSNEKVHVIAYNTNEKNRIINLLNNAGVPLTNIDFLIRQTNDVWVRDNGPIYVYDENGDLVLEDWGFNGWGGDYNYDLCNPVPTVIANSNSMPVVDLNNVMTIEGGSYELDGNGVLLATKSAILSQSNPSPQIKSIRNPGMTESEANAILTQYIGATKFYWLDGAFSTDDITDFHIDGFAKFVPGNKLVTMNNADLLYWGVTQSDINILYGMTNVDNVPFTKIYIPLTQNDVVKTDGTPLGFKGSYANYYVANGVVLVPNYNDPNDAVANNIIAGLYPGRTVVGINVRNLYESGGMVHCVTQQQPLHVTVGSNTNSICPGESATLTAGGASNYSWSPSTGLSATTGASVIASPSVTTTYQVIGNVGTGADTNYISIIVNTVPPVPTITQNSNSLTSSSVSGNQWYVNGNAISGANEQNYTPVENGNYTVIVTENGCSSASSAIFQYTGSTSEMMEINKENDDILIYPNPGKGKFTLKFPGMENSNYEIRIHNDLGQLILNDSIQSDGYKTIREFDLRPYGSGIYHLQLTDGISIRKKKIVIYP